MAAKILNSKHNLWIRLSANHLFRANQSSVSLSTLSEPNAGSKEEVIKIPKRIERGPTDILRALADVTQRDLNGPHYRYIDDPFLTPLSHHQKRIFSLARESGRRAAKYVFEEFPELFIRDVSEPKVEAFTYKEIYDENTEVDETDLKKCIARKEVNHAIVCYKNLVRDSKPISAENLQKLLELVCFYNCEDPPDPELITEKIFMKPSDTQRVFWKDNGFAEQLFNAIEHKTSDTYCALIQGMAKYSQSQKAHELYQEMIEKGFKLNVETYNSMIKVTPMLRESIESRWLYVEELLNSMKRNGVKPNLRTMNNVLNVITRFGANIRYSQTLAKRLLVEMTNNLGIEPSLATYNDLINIFYNNKENIQTSPALYEIMDRIEDKEFEIQDPNDCNFFVNAMHICMTRLNDVQMAHRINEMAFKPKNSLFFGSVLRENNFYQKYFKILTKVEEINKFMEIYDKYVPHVYVPEQVVMSDIFRAIELYEAYSYLPRIWEDLKQFEYVNNVELTQEFFAVLSKAKVDSSMARELAKIVSEAITMIDNKIENQLKYENILHYQFSGQMLGYAIHVYLKDNDFEKVIKVTDKLLNEKKKVFGTPSPQSLFNLFQKAVEQKKIPIAKHCIEVCADLEMSEVIVRALDYVKESDVLDKNIQQSLEEFCVSKLGSTPVLESAAEGMTERLDFIEEDNDLKI